MKFVRKFSDTETRDEVLAIVDYEVLSYTEGVGVKIKTQGSGPEPDVPTDRIILKFMVTEGDWNEDAGKYKKQLVGENCGSIFYDGSCFNYMIKDDKRIDKDFWSQFIYFDTLGEHTVELIFDKEFDGNLPENCLRGCYMHEAIISNNVTSIGSGAFCGCTSLTSVTIPNSVTTLFDEVFKNCSNLTSVTIPTGVTSIGADAFCMCSNLTSVNIPAGVTSINYGAFRECSSLTAVSIPSGVTLIDTEAFAVLNSLTSVNIPSTVTTINYGAFRDCRHLTSITCNAINPPDLGGNAFNTGNNCPIYVPAASVDAYKAATGWSEYASRIQTIQ